jgi:hypothetical protein
VGRHGGGGSKVTGHARVRWLTEVTAALWAVYMGEVEEMRFEGPLDDVLVGMDLFEEVEATAYELGTNEEVEATTRMAKTLSAPLVLVNAERNKWVSQLSCPISGSSRDRAPEWVRCMVHRLEQFTSATVSLFDSF